MPSIRAFAPAAILSLGCAFIWNARTQAAVPLVKSLDAVMPSMAGYRVQNQVLSEEEQRVAGMSQYVARAYWRDSLPEFTTFVSYYDRQTQGKTIHSPRNCLPGAGWEVLTAGTATMIVDGKPATINRYTLRNAGATALVYYWYQGRGRIVADEYRVKWNLLRDAAVAGHTEEALVRVVVPIAAPASADGRTLQARFADADALGARIASQLANDVASVLPPG